MKLERYEIEKILKDYNSRNYKVGESDSLIHAEEVVSLLKRFLNHSIDEEDFLRGLYEEEICPDTEEAFWCNKPYNEENCTACWKNCLSSIREDK